MWALADVVRQIADQQLVLLTGQAGDRSDRDIADFVAAAACGHRCWWPNCPATSGRRPFEVPG
jgi:hypothetical protein